MKNKGNELFINIGIIFFSFLLVVMLLYTTYHFYQAGAVYTESADSLLRYIEIGEYGELVRCMYKNEAAEAKITTDMAECYAVARYYEAASFYKVYFQNGRMEEAEKKKKIMEEQKLLMGDLAYVEEDIIESLELVD